MKNKDKVGQSWTETFEKDDKIGQKSLKKSDPKVD